MRTCILITKSKFQKDIENLFNDNDITESLYLSGKSTSPNFLMELLSLYTDGLSIFCFKIKLNQEKILSSFLESDKQYCNSLLIKLKKEREMEELEKNIENKEKVDKKYSKLIVSILPAGFNELVVDCVKEVGESGATILGGKGMGKNYSSFMGMNLESEREIILVATTFSKAKKLISEIRKNFLKNKVKGVVFSLPIEDFKNFNK